MHAAYEDPSGYRIGDKVRIKRGQHTGIRGIISATDESLLKIKTASGDVVQASIDEVTNYSLAARRAWQSMPKRAGRPRLDAAAKKKMISLRIDIDVWNGLAKAAEQGLIPSREQAVNAWLKEQLEALLAGCDIHGDRT